ncbi:MAG: hypothetical protein OFPII_09200 [Osedax symbiont Rs1]|nr:MAG: hypothetical protein OFPII_09200 [Osedax symbiont Rs1]
MKIQCHCANIVIEVDKPARVTQCNCSICSRYHSLWGYYAPEQVKIFIGASGSDSYAWGDKELDFVRCSDCGCVTHYQTQPGQGTPRVAVNFGMDRKAVNDVPIRYFDGAKEL